MNAIFSIADNYGHVDLTPFLMSFRNTNNKDDIVIFHKNLKKGTIKKLEKYKVNWVEYDSNQKNNIILSPNSLRYFFYKDYLESNSQYQMIALADIRDIFFQGNPFEIELNTGISFFLEDDEENIGINTHTRTWIEHSYGKKLLLEIGENPISCSGYTIGLRSPIIKYLEKMTSELSKFENMGGLDQGIHNYLIYTKQISDFELIPDDEGYVGTFSYFKNNSLIRFNECGQLLNKVNKPLHVIHQYDRFWSLLWKYNRVYYFRKRWNLFKRFLLKILSNN